MNKKFLYIIGALIVVVIIVLITMAMGGSNDTTGDTAGGDDQGTTSSQSLNQLYASGKSQKCTFEAVDDGGLHSSGIVYVADGHMRGDFSSEVKNADAVESHMIVQDGGVAYVWSSAMPQGVKLSFANLGSQGSTSGSVDTSKKADYSCSSWSEDHAKFDVPTDVTFIDASAIVPGASR